MENMGKIPFSPQICFDFQDFRPGPGDYAAPVCFDLRRRRLGGVQQDHGRATCGEPLGEILMGVTLW